VKHKPLQTELSQKGSFSFHSSQNIYTCHFKTSALLIVSIVDTKLDKQRPKNMRNALAHSNGKCERKVSPAMLFG
jgi:hypothetical protein